MTPQAKRMKRRGSVSGPSTQNRRAGDPRRIQALRRELADAERALAARAQRKAERVDRTDQDALREACDTCRVYDRIRPNATARLEAIRAGSPERFRGEQRLAEMALRQADRADAAYTVIAFAKERHRLRYLLGGAKREALIREALARGGVYTDGYGGRNFKEIVRWT